MGFRFRKSIRVGKLGRINLSKSGVGASVGVPGFRVGIGSDGKVRTTVGIPGTGIYNTQVVGGAKPARTCHACGRNVAQSDKFCRRCGARLR